MGIFLLFNAGRIFITTFWIVNPTWRIPLAWMSYCPKFKMTQDFFFEVVFLPLSNAFSAVCKSPYRRTTLYSIHSPNRQYNKIKLSFMTSIALLYKHCTSWGQKVSEHSDGHPCWKIIPIFFSRFFWLNGRERAIWWRYNVPHYYYSFYCPNSFMIETLLLQHSALKFEF